MNFRPNYVCRNCGERFEHKKIFSEKCDNDSIESTVKIVRDKVQIPDSSLVYQSLALNAPLQMIHKCSDKFIGIADLVGIEYYEDEVINT